MRQMDKHSHFRITLSAPVTNAQKLGAQYAWFNPRVNGNNLESTWGIWPISAKGPSDTTKTAMIALARDRKFLSWISPVGEIQ